MQTFFARGVQQLAVTFDLDADLIRNLIFHGADPRGSTWVQEKAVVWTQASVRNNILARIDPNPNPDKWVLKHYDEMRDLAKNVPPDHVCAAIGWWKTGHDWAADDTTVLAQEQDQGQLANLLSAVDVSKLNSLTLNSLMNDIEMMDAQQCLSPGLEKVFKDIYAWQRKAQKKSRKRAKRIAAIHQQAEAQPDDMDLHARLLEDLAEMGEPRPSEDTVLGKSLAAMTTPPDFEDEEE